MKSPKDILDYLDKKVKEKADSLGKGHIKHTGEKVEKPKVTR